MTQRTASTRLDLPQPFGPTTPVSPGSISKSVGSTKDLKPIRRSRVSFIRLASPIPLPRRCRESLNAHAENSCRKLELWRGRGAASARRMNRRDSERNTRRRIIQTFALPAPRRPIPMGRPGGRGRGKKPLSCLEIGVDFLGHLVDREVADQALAVDEESGRRINPELVDGMVAHRLDVVEHLL